VIPIPFATPSVQPAIGPSRWLVSMMLPGSSRNGVVIAASPRPALCMAVSALELVDQSETTSTASAYPTRVAPRLHLIFTIAPPVRPDAARHGTCAQSAPLWGIQ